MDSDSTSFDQNMFDQYDLLSYTLPTGDVNLATDQPFTNTFFSNLSEQNVGSGVTNTAPVPSPCISNFYSSNMEGISPLDASFLPHTALSTPLPTPDYCTPSTHPLQDDLEVRRVYKKAVCLKMDKITLFFLLF